MYRQIISARVKAGKNIEVRQVAQELADYLNKNYSPNKTQIGNQMFGEVGNISWFVDYESLAVIEEINQKLPMDGTYQAIIAKLADILIEGSGKVKLYNIP